MLKTKQAFFNNLHISCRQFKPGWEPGSWPASSTQAAMWADAARAPASRPGRHHPKPSTKKMYHPPTAGCCCLHVPARAPTTHARRVRPGGYGLCSTLPATTAASMTSEITSMTSSIMHLFPSNVDVPSRSLARQSSSASLHDVLR